MPATVSIVIFGAILLVAMGVIYALSGGSLLITERLGRLSRLPGHERLGFRESQRKLFASFLAWVARLLPSPTQSSEGDPRLIQAGFRRPEAATAMHLGRAVSIAAVVSLVVFTGYYKNNPYVLIPVAMVIGFMLPDFWLSRKIRARQQILRLALPDALDLLVICMEAGLGIDQAFLYVSQELRIAHRELCEEFDMVNAEMHVGKTRIEALRSLASRTGVDDLQALVATLIQTDRFGTSVAQSLRVHSDDLRVKRRQRAEEMAAKTTVKMVIPLVLFIFPALFVVIMGPAVITMIDTLGHLTGH
jgi:tight adherence protein C